MHAQLQTRLTTLKAEYETGEQMLVELEQKQRTLRDTLLRISGAIQVLEEVLAQPDDQPTDGPANGDPAAWGRIAAISR